MYLRYLLGLRRFLAEKLTPEAARRQLREALARREASFLDTLAEGVFAREESPYRALLRHAGIELRDVSALVAEAGLEGALERLHEAGVYVTLDEFKGRVPIRRGSLEVPVRPEDFDNPLAVRHYVMGTSGSRGPSRVVKIDLSMLAYEGAYLHCYLDAFGIRERPLALWRGVPPVGSGLNRTLRYARIGKPVDRWFAQNRIPLRPSTVSYRLTLAATVAVARASGWPVPSPEYVHQDDAVRIARWLAGLRDEGRPAHLDTNASSGVRLCLAARDHGLDISGTFFRFGGEPFTEAKEAVVEAAGCRAVCHYSMDEALQLGTACGAAEHRDEVHVMTDKLALIRREKRLGTDGQKVGVFVFSTLLRGTGKLMLNVESDDYGQLERRRCGCVLGELGFDLHAWDLRSYEKLTSEGMSYLGNDLLRLVEEVLPDRFGGQPTHYQLVEEEEEGMPRVSLVVSPSVGEIDEAAILDAVYEVVGQAPGGRLMSEFWEAAGTVRVVRRQPYATHSAKILPLHVVR